MRTVAEKPLVRMHGRLRVAILLSALAPVLLAASESTSMERVRVAWAPTEVLSEVKDNSMQRGWMKPEDWMRSLSEGLRRRAERVLPPDQHLDVTITDIKLAGGFEPWHRIELQDVRYMRDVYPPRINLQFTLRSSDGTELRTGERKLRDLAYLQRSTHGASDPLRYDKRLLDEWLYSEFGEKKR